MGESSMRVKPSQLVPGCMLVNDVTGKTGQPLIPKETVLTKETIQFLEKFLVNSVQVSTRLATGDVFIPREIKDKDDESIPTNTQVSEQKTDSIMDHYLTVVMEYK